MAASDWVLPIFVAFVLYWPVFAVVAILILGPLLGFVIVGVIGAIRAGVSGKGDGDESDDDDPDDLFSELVQASTTGRNDSI
ncbi:hypothetical protein ASE16_04440 [Leifsonia sp. Root227]|uniref:hypothetical protein n=1 Tax=Leifsonia sp. Root227 TaxID=1736496 RepID=UPI0006F98436|nr:hypothetical protein [Leifsonia sp. Root227]KRC52285.1 hypothetical protein ASE16_04440 [Leifsonia sp. Root227]